MKKRARKACEVFKKCPACHSENVAVIEEEVFCGQCAWNSIEASVNAGCMDDLFKIDVNQLDTRGTSRLRKIKAPRRKTRVARFEETQRPIKAS